jgi:hypothetical protein
MASCMSKRVSMMCVRLKRSVMPVGSCGGPHTTPRTLPPLPPGFLLQPPILPPPYSPSRATRVLSQSDSLPLLSRCGSCVPRRCTVHPADALDEEKVSQNDNVPVTVPTEEPVRGMYLASNVGGVSSEGVASPIPGVWNPSRASPPAEGVSNAVICNRQQTN